MRITISGVAVLTTAVMMAALSGCGASSTSPQGSAVGDSGSLSSSTPSSTASGAAAGSPSPTTTPSGSPSSSSAKLAPALLTLADLPSGFRSEPLTIRNLPSLIHGCPGLEELQATGIGDQAQAEWTRGALDAYIDEAVIQPQGDTAAGLVEKTAKALDQCGSVQVVEEGLSVKLTAAPLALAKVGDASHAWHTTGKYAGISMEMNVVLAQAGSLVVLLAETHVSGQTDDALTLQAAQASVARAMAFQKSS
jgi:hypothetical protein